MFGPIEAILDSIGLLNFVLAIILFLISILITIILHFRNKKKKKPTYAIQGFDLLPNEISDMDEIKVLWNGKQLRHLSLSRITIWNRGNEPIRREDIAPAGNIHIAVDSELEMLACKIKKYSDHTNHFQAHMENKSVIVEFAYISPHEGAVIDVYCTGIGGEQFFISGTVIGAGPFQLGEYGDDHKWISFISPITQNITFLNSFIKKKIVRYKYRIPNGLNL